MGGCSGGGDDEDGKNVQYQSSEFSVTKTVTRNGKLLHKP